MLYLKSNEDLKRDIHLAIVGSDDPKGFFDELFNWFIFVEHQYIDNDKEMSR